MIEEEKKNYYELGFLSREEENQTIKNLLLEKGGEVLKEGPLSKVELAYPIKKNKYAFFGYFYFTLAAEKVNEVKESLRWLPSVLRFILLKLPKIVVKKIFQETQQKEDLKIVSSKKDLKAEPKKEYLSEPAKNLLTNEDLEKKLKEILKEE